MSKDEADLNSPYLSVQKHLLEPKPADLELSKKINLKSLVSLNYSDSNIDSNSPIKMSNAANEQIMSRNLGATSLNVKKGGEKGGNTQTTVFFKSSQ